MKLAPNILTLSIFTAILIAPKTQAQITANPGDADTVVNQSGDTFTITGGTKVDKNVFHSLQKFGLNENQIADFVTNPGTQNVLGRITGGDASVINGLIKVTGSNANLYLMNPAGIIFGSGASLNIPGSFTATTANGIGFGDKWFNALGTNNYADLVGEPNSFAFTMSQPGAIAIDGFVNLSVKSGQNLTLVGGTVVNTRKLNAPAGNITIATVSGEKIVRITQPGNLLSLETQNISEFSSLPNNWSLNISSLPELLTGGGVTNATDLTISEDGTEVKLTGSGLKIETGDLVVDSVFSRNATLSSSRNLVYVEAFEKGLTTTENLNLIAEDTVQILDGTDFYEYLTLHAGGNLKIQGNQNIDIQLVHDKSALHTGGNLDLISNGIINGNARFIVGNNFSVKNLSGGAGNFNSTLLNSSGTNPQGIISSNGDVNFGNYEGSSLKVEAKGSISAGDIKINQPNASLAGTDPDIAVLKNSPSLILRAGLSELRNTASTSPTSVNGTTFESNETSVLSGNITVGNITIEPSKNVKVLGPVILSAKNNINVNGNINSLGGFLTDNNLNNRGVINSPISLISSEGSISVLGDIKAGNTMILSKKDISTENIFAERNQDIRRNDIALLNSETGKITLNSIQATFGSIDINAADVLKVKGTFPTNFVDTSASDIPTSIRAQENINIQHGGTKFNDGIGVEKDIQGTTIYRITDSGKRVFIIKENNLVKFVDDKGEVVSEEVTVKDVDLDINDIPASESFTAGLILQRRGFNQTVSAVFPDEFLENSDINVVGVPKPDKISSGNESSNGQQSPGNSSDNGTSNGGESDNNNSNNQNTPNGEVVQRQLNQDEKKEVCSPQNQTVALNKPENTRGGTTTNNSQPSNSNPCKTADDNNDILKVIPDNRFNSNSALPTFLFKLGQQ